MDDLSVIVYVNGDSGGEVKSFDFHPFTLGDRKCGERPMHCEAPVELYYGSRKVHVWIREDMAYCLISDDTHLPHGPGFRTGPVETPYIMSDEVLAAAIDVARAFAFPAEYAAWGNSKAAAETAEQASVRNAEAEIERQLGIG